MKEKNEAVKMCLFWFLNFAFPRMWGYEQKLWKQRKVGWKGGGAGGLLRFIILW